MSLLPLFDEPPSVNQSDLAQRLADLAREGVYFGTSSWKYEGWLGSIYTPERYYVRGKFSKKRFEETCLHEYADTFPVVCGDFSYYNFPSETQWRALFQNAPEKLRFAFKVPEAITVRTFPAHPRYGARAGGANDLFLDPDAFRRLFLEPLEPYRRRVSLLILEFSAFPRKSFRETSEFTELLDRFFAAVPKEWRYSVEIRNTEFFEEEYFACLRTHGAAHVFNAWTRVPELPDQIAIAEAFTAPFTVARALLRAGRSYEEAVEAFSPYERVQDENPEARAALRELMSRARQMNEEAYLFVNNRLEGNAPGTIAAVVGT